LNPVGVNAGGESSHGPPPSLWPVGFAVGIVCILVGLIVSWPVVAVGAGITLIFGFLWIRDVTRGYRTVDEADAEAPPAEHASAAPETPPDEAAARYPRSKFLEGATLGLGAAIGAVVTIPAVGFAVVPAFVDQGQDDIDLGPLSNFRQGEWQIVHFELNPKEGDVARRTAYIRYNGLLDNEPSFTIISNRCAHLGCPVQPGGLVQPDRTKDQRTSGGQEITYIPVLGLSSFTCPCHGGSYDSEGNRTAGPPVRALDRYDFSIKNGNLFLGDAFSVSTVDGQGAQAIINKYNLAGPGQHVDGPEQWFYPWQPPH
jgi:quinol---cytochrome c reductase iron-sulfur subunit, bacillus type